MRRSCSVAAALMDVGGLVCVLAGNTPEIMMAVAAGRMFVLTEATIRQQRADELILRADGADCSCEQSAATNPARD